MATTVDEREIGSGQLSDAALPQVFDVAKDGKIIRTDMK